MSWQAYTDNLVQLGKIDKAALYSKAGDLVWAVLNDFTLYQPEITAIVQGFDDPLELQQSGLHAQQQKYFVLRATDLSIYGKQGQEGLVCVRTGQAVLVAHYPEGVLATDAAVVVEKLAEYLRSVGY